MIHSIGYNYNSYNGYSNYNNYNSLPNVDRQSGMQEECDTCKNRKYQDGSDEMVSFKTPGNIAPEESYAKVMGHEREHVANAIAEGSEENKELVSVSVSLKTDICPECGKAYISGGTTNTAMKTYNDDPYSQSRKLQEQESLAGQVVDYAV